MLDKVIRSVISEFPYIQKCLKQKPMFDIQISQKMQYMKVLKGETVFYQDQKPELFYFVMKGKLAVLLA